MTTADGLQPEDGLTPGTGLGGMSGKTELLIPGTPNSYDLPKPMTTLAMQGCSIKDRFDRKATLAYNFSDEQSQIAFNLSGRGAGAKGLGRMDFKGVGLRFTYKLQKFKTAKERCLYPSAVQGLFGSLYNEFSQREHDTIVQELRAQGLDF